MKWNYRLVEVETPEGTYVGLFEVYYDDDDIPTMRTTDPTYFVDDGEDAKEDIIKSLKRAVENASKYPVLIDKEVFNNQ